MTRRCYTTFGAIIINMIVVYALFPLLVTKPFYVSTSMCGYISCLIKFTNCKKYSYNLAMFGVYILDTMRV